MCVLGCKQAVNRACLRLQGHIILEGTGGVRRGVARRERGGVRRGRLRVRRACRTHDRESCESEQLVVRGCGQLGGLPPGEVARTHESVAR